MVHVNAGRLTHYPGGYQYYLDKTKATSERAGLTAGNSLGQRGSARPQRGFEPAAGTVRKDQKRAEAEQRQARSRDRKAQETRVKQLETQIQDLEARQSKLIVELEKPETYEKSGSAVAINRELMEIQDRLAALNPEWEKAAGKLEQSE